MPLEHGASRAAFEHNLKTELAAGKPQAQALAIAYAQKRGDSEPDVVAEKLDALTMGCNALASRLDAQERADAQGRINARADAAPAKHVIEIEASGEFVPQLAAFLQQCGAIAAVGHSFDIEADKEMSAEYEGGHPRIGFDGDGADRIHEVRLDGKVAGKAGLK